MLPFAGNFLTDSQMRSVVSAGRETRCSTQQVPGSSPSLHLTGQALHLFLLITLCSSSFWRRMDIALDALGKSSWLKHRLGYLYWSLTQGWLPGSCTPHCCLSPPRELYIAACPPIHPTFPCANSSHWILILFLMGSVLPTQYTTEYI